MSVALNAKTFLVAMFVFALVALFSSADVQLLNEQQGYRPEQPLAYSHRLHAGELGIDCLYCHYGARTSRHAGVPPAELCMNCHATVTAGMDAVVLEKEAAEEQGREERPITSPELSKLYAALGRGPDGQLNAGIEPQPLEWVRVHNLPDFVYFNHSVHVTRGVACESCHGPVSSMDKVRQEGSMGMGWCIDCHRAQGVTRAIKTETYDDRERKDMHVSTDCAACHY